MRRLRWISSTSSGGAVVSLPCWLSTESAEEPSKRLNTADEPVHGGEGGSGGVLGAAERFVHRGDRHEAAHRLAHLGDLVPPVVEPSRLDSGRPGVDALESHIE